MFSWLSACDPEIPSGYAGHLMNKSPCQPCCREDKHVICHRSCVAERGASVDQMCSKSSFLLSRMWNRVQRAPAGAPMNIRQRRGLVFVDNGRHGDRSLRGCFQSCFQKAGEGQKLKGLELPESSRTHLYSTYLLTHMTIQASVPEYPVPYT